MANQLGRPINHSFAGDRLRLFAHPRPLVALQLGSGWPTPAGDDKLNPGHTPPSRAAGAGQKLMVLVYCQQTYS